MQHESVQTSSWSFIVRKFGESIDEEKQMTGLNATGASSNKSIWNNINWTQVEAHVHRLQMRIAKATREGRYGKVKALQWLLTHSWQAKLLSAKRVTDNKGAKTAGVDGNTCQSPTAKLDLAKALKSHGYKAKPLRRVYIPKKNGKQRPLGIPTIHDRAMQAIYLLALEPVAETTADPNSYGFRSGRSTVDAIEQCFRALSKRDQAHWILECDIKSCFDKIDHDWLLKNIPINRKILQQWLKAGYLEEQVLYPTQEGTPQGGIISPTLANMALDGLERELKQFKGQKVHIIRYADDFVITGKSVELLECKIKPCVENFLKIRGLELSQEKTGITHINKGFDFLGFNVRKYNDKLLIKPSKASMHSLLRRVRTIIKSYRGKRTDLMIGQINPKIRGWANYYRHVVAKKVFGYVDDQIYRAIAGWTRRRHNNKNFDWIRKTYFRKEKLRNWVFFGIQPLSNGESKIIDLFKASDIPIQRHLKIKSEARLYEPAYHEYFAQRKRRKQFYGKMQHHFVLKSIGFYNRGQWLPTLPLPGRS